MRSQKEKIFLFVPIFLIIILGFIIYFNSLQGKFIWDDELLVKNNTYIKQLDKITKFFTADIGVGSDARYNFYRPLQMLSYSLDYSFWRLNVLGYHLTNLLLHIFVTLSIYYLIYLLFSERILSFLASILFLVHPIHTEVVSYISGRADSLSALFLLLSIIFYINYIRSENKRQYYLCLLIYIFALLSKENCLVMPLLALLYHYVFGNKIKLRIFLPILIVSLIYVIFRLTILKFPPSYFAATTFFQRAPGFFVAITEYLKLLIFSFNLHMEHGRQLFSFSNPKTITGIIIVATLLIYFLRYKKASRLMIFSIGWFFITVLPQSNLYPINAYMAEHWLYLPSIGFFLIFSYFLTSLYKIKKLKAFAISIMIYILAFYSYLTISQNNYWKEPITFYKRTLKFAPGNPLIYYNLANAYSQKSENEKAIKQYQKAIEINPHYLDAYINLCKAYINIGANKKAEETCIKAIQINPNDAMSYYFLAEAYTNTADNEKAIKFYLKAIAIKPDYLEAYNNLASLYADTGKLDTGIELWEKAVQIDPNFSIAHFNLAVFYYHQGKYDLAIKHCDKLIELGDSVDAKFLNLLKPHRK